ncbi:pleckstrin homology domain-containing family B member 2-like isoform X2 [Centruroides vittatus]|uniref:pleckstrin homology domain-containing family B member 2-like isoform X2 n=1 Tax=Centruroides vittatus TaxID=120091 RepID=UPI00350F9CD6
MSCFGEDSIKVSNMASPLKSGYMLKYKKRLFCKDWKEHYVTLYNDSTLVWYKDRHSNEQEGGIYIKNSPDLMAFGEFTQQVPNRPELPSGYTAATLMVFGTRGKESVHWFLCKYELEIKEWISAIISTLPPPPQPPQYATQPANNPSAPMTEEPQQKPVSELPPASTNPPVLPSYQAAIPGQFPPQTMAHFQQSPYPQQIGPLQPGYPMRQQPNNTTVVVQDRQNNSGSDFAVGMLMGGAMGYTMGHGFGWGCGSGWGGGIRHDTDIHIHNNYDINNHIQNDTNVHTDNTNVFDNDVPDTFEVDDDFGADFDGGGFDGVDF